MVTIEYVGAIKRNGKSGGRGPRWCYLGKDIPRRQFVSGILGEDKRIYFKDRLYKIVRRARRGYLDFVGNLGKDETDRLAWWAGKFSSKNPFHTDFFLLICYAHLARELLDESETTCNEGLVIVVEDPWLFVQLKRNLISRDVVWKGAPRISLYRFFCVARGCVRRFFLPVWFAVAKIMMRFYRDEKKPSAMTGRSGAVAFINPAEKRAFNGDGGYESHYLPGLHDLFLENNRDSFYLYLFPFPLSTAKNAGMNEDVLWPLIHDAGWLSILKRTFQAWHPARKGVSIDGHDFSLLFERERWVAFSDLGFNFHLIQHDALVHLMKRGWISSFVYLFENQSWEKMLCMAASRHGCKAIGYQHSSICTYYISQFIGEEEWKHAPLPYKLVTSGKHSARLYAEGGIPKEKIEIGGAWRYRHLVDGRAHHSAGGNKEPRSKSVMLVALPLDTSVGESLLMQLFDALRSSGAADAVEIVIKPHPGTVNADLAGIRSLASGYRLAFEPFVDLMESADVVLASTSTSGLEAFLSGKKVVTYMPENLIVPDPLLDVEDARIRKWFEGDRLDVDFLLRPADPGRTEDDVQENVSLYFSKVDREKWIELIS